MFHKVFYIKCCVWCKGKTRSFLQITYSISGAFHLEEINHCIFLHIVGKLYPAISDIRSEEIVDIILVQRIKGSFLSKNLPRGFLQKTYGILTAKMT